MLIFPYATLNVPLLKEVFKNTSSTRFGKLEGTSTVQDAESFSMVQFLKVTVFNAPVSLVT